MPFQLGMQTGNVRSRKQTKSKPSYHGKSPICPISYPTTSCAEPRSSARTSNSSSSGKTVSRTDGSISTDPGKAASSISTNRTSADHSSCSDVSELNRVLNPKSGSDTKSYVSVVSSGSSGTGLSLHPIPERNGRIEASKERSATSPRSSVRGAHAVLPSLDVAAEIVRAVEHARRIRKRLVAARPAALKNLAGDCGLASIMLAVRLNDPNSLRACEDHAWNEIGNTVIDITATQFCSKIRGVYVGERRDFHQIVIASGLAAYHEVVGWGTYEKEACWQKLSNYW